MTAIPHRHIGIRRSHSERRAAVRDAQADYEATLRAAMKADAAILRQREADDDGVIDTAGKSIRSAHHARTPKEAPHEEN